MWIGQRRMVRLQMVLDLPGMGCGGTSWHTSHMNCSKLGRAYRSERFGLKCQPTPQSSLVTGSDTPDADLSPHVGTAGAFVGSVVGVCVEKQLFKSAVAASATAGSDASPFKPIANNPASISDSRLEASAAALDTNPGSSNVLDLPITQYVADRRAVLAIAGAQSS